MSQTLSKKSKTLWLVIIGILVIALAVLVYLYQKGSIETSADEIVSTDQVELENAVPIFRYYNTDTDDHFYTQSIHGDVDSENWNNLEPEGILGYCSSTQVEGTAPIYRYYNSVTKDHFYTQYDIDDTNDTDEENWANLTKEGVLCYAYQEQLEGTVPVYRYWNSVDEDHFYTQAAYQDPNQEIWTNLTPEGILGYFYQPQENLVPVLRYYSSSTGDHFYTTAIHGDPEKESNWDLFVPEGITGYCYSTQVTGTVPIYRYWNSIDEDHFYTQYNIDDTNDADKENWTNLTKEGVLCYAYPNEATGTVPVYRYYNSTDGDHFYTVYDIDNPDHADEENWTNLTKESIDTLAYFYPYPVIDLSYSYEFNLTAYVDDNGNLILNWTAVPGASYYSVYDCEDNLIADTLTTNTYTIEDIADGDYCFYAVAYDASGNVIGQTGNTSITVDNGEVTDRNVDQNSTVTNTSSATSSQDTSDDSSVASVTSLVSTGASLWFNILIAIAIIAAVGYFMFRDEIFNKE